MPTSNQSSLDKEVEYRRSIGNMQVPFQELQEKIRALGYRFNRDMDCKSLARHMTGTRAGESYPSNALYPVQIDDGLSWSNVDARRDANFNALNELRDTHFSVHGGYIYEW